MNTGENFKSNGSDVAYSVQDFLLWNSSDLTNDNVRNSLACFIIAKAIGSRLDKFNNLSDCKLNFKGFEINVNSAIVCDTKDSFVYSNIIFHFKGGLKYSSSEKKRYFIFCLYSCKSISQIEITNLDNWQFYILKENALRDKINKVDKITLSDILKLNPTDCKYSNLKSKIDKFQNSIIYDEHYREKIASLRPLPTRLIYELAYKVSLSDKPISLSLFVGTINENIDTTQYKKLVSSKVSDFLVDQGLLSQEPEKNGRYYRTVTEKGNSIGITREEIKDEKGNSYIGNLYNKEAQKYILKHLYQIFMFNKGAYTIRKSVMEDIHKNSALIELKDCGVNMDEDAQVEKVTEHTCKNCMELRRGDCPGHEMICEDFRFSPTFLPNVTAYWPTK